MCCHSEALLSAFVVRACLGLEELKRTRRAAQSACKLVKWKLSHTTAVHPVLYNSNGVQPAPQSSPRAGEGMSSAPQAWDRRCAPRAVCSPRRDTNPHLQRAPRSTANPYIWWIRQLTPQKLVPQAWHVPRVGLFHLHNRQPLAFSQALYFCRTKDAMDGGSRSLGKRTSSTFARAARPNPEPRGFPFIGSRDNKVCARYFIHARENPP